MTRRTPRLRRSEHLMGTVATLELCDPLPQRELERLADAVFDWLHAVDRRFTTYQDTSEVNRLDRGEITLSECSDDLRGVLDECAELWRRTDGYFDVYATGRLDPSGFVKGWSVQVASERLVAAGAANHYLEAGGDVQTRGCPAPGSQWEVGIRHPFETTMVCGVVAGTDLAIATSGTYERGLHVVDPRTGRPSSALRSVTVVGRDLGMADAFATAAVAMGTAGPAWLSSLPAHECLVVTESGDCLTSAGLPLVTGPPAAAGDGVA